MRTATGVTALAQGGIYLTSSNESRLAIWLAGFLAIASGASIFIGFLTPIASILLTLDILGIALSWLPAPSPNLLDTKLSETFAIIMTAAILFLGPGAFSIDARLFGRREIIIPQASRPPKP